MKHIENDLLSSFKRIKYWSAYSYTNDANTGAFDSLEKANTSFQQLLLRYTDSIPATISAEFTKLKDEGLLIASAGDGNFRIYSWDMLTGGTMHFFQNVYQYQPKRVFGEPNRNVHSRVIESQDEGDPKSFYTSIYFVPQYGFGSLYMAISSSIYDSRYGSQQIKVFKVEDGGLNDSLRIINTDAGLVNETGFEDYYYSDSSGKRLVIGYEMNGQTIVIPETGDEGMPTGRVFRYHFNGSLFEPSR